MKTSHYAKYSESQMAAQQVHCSLQQIEVQSVVLWSDPSPTVTVLTFIVSSTVSSLNPG